MISRRVRLSPAYRKQGDRKQGDQNDGQTFGQVESTQLSDPIRYVEVMARICLVNVGPLDLFTGKER